MAKFRGITPEEESIFENVNFEICSPVFLKILPTFSEQLLCTKTASMK